jgi:hypothetical protein
VVATLLAIWQFSGTDVLWRTVASCAVIGGGTLAFAMFNAVFDSADVVEWQERSDREEPPS